MCSWLRPVAVLGVLACVGLVRVNSVHAIDFFENRIVKAVDAEAITVEPRVVLVINDETEILDRRGNLLGKGGDAAVRHLAVGEKVSIRFYRGAAHAIWK